MAQWKKLGLIGLLFCVALMVLLAAVARPPRPAPTDAQANPWNSAAIAGTLENVRVQEVDPTHAALLLSYDLENRTNTDYRMASGPGLTIMSRIERDGALTSDREPIVAAAAFVPAKSRVRISLEMDHTFNWPWLKDPVAEGALRQFVADQVAGVGGFVLFDQAARYQIELPVASPQIPGSAATTRQN